MRPSACHIGADQRRREIELAFAYLFAPALLTQRIALDIFSSAFEAAPVGSALQMPATAPEAADEFASAASPEVPLRPTPRPRRKPSSVVFEPAGAAASPP